MSLTFGKLIAGEITFGNLRVAKMYFGNRLFWERQSPTPFDNDCVIYMDDDALSNNIFRWGVRNNRTGADLSWEIGRTNYWLYGPDGTLIENKATSARSRDINDLPDGTYQINLNCENGYIENNKIPDSGTVSFICTKVKMWKYKYYFEFIDLDNLNESTTFSYHRGSFKIGNDYITFEQLYDVQCLNGNWQSISDDDRKSFVTRPSNDNTSIWGTRCKFYVNSDIEITNFTFESSTYYDPRNGHTIHVDLYNAETSEKIGEDEFISNGGGSTYNTITLNF